MQGMQCTVTSIYRYNAPSILLDLITYHNMHVRSPLL